MKVIGIRNGYQGLLENEFVELDNHIVSGRVRDAGTFLQTSRCPEMMTEAGQRKALEILAQNRIDGLVVIGGDGSLRGAQVLHRFGVRVIGLPGTIDNDIYGTDMSIGVDTALNTIISLVDMIRATAASHRRCFVVEVMGRASGYLALMATISTGSQVAVIPEFRVNYDSIVRVLHDRFDAHHNNSVILVAEGVCQGADFMQRLIGTGKVAQEVRLTVLGHIQRGGTPTHYDRLLASRMGEMAVLALESGETGMMVATVNGKTQLCDFDDILDRRKRLPGDAIRLARNIGIEIGDVVEP
jgi:6-phosphofructokinase 1